MPYETLGRLFGISHETASTYYEELLNLFHEELVGRLLYPLSADETAKITPAEFRADLPDVLVIWDATGFKLKSKEDVLLSRILYSAYHHQSEGLVVFGTYCGVVACAVMRFDVVLPNMQAARPMADGFFAQKYLEGSRLRL
jgi:hypothetical protein